MPYNAGALLRTNRTNASEASYRNSSGSRSVRFMRAAPFGGPWLGRTSMVAERGVLSISVR